MKLQVSPSLAPRLKHLDISFYSLDAMFNSSNGIFNCSDAYFYSLNAMFNSSDDVFNSLDACFNSSATS